jgi:tRNA A-37 threonylcarbamoyl transferase component Bud32
VTDFSSIPGHTISHYRIIEKLGGGGMGVVYRAHDEQLDRDVALKVLPAGTLSDEAARKQFRKEALALAKLNHPNIATVFEFGSQDGIDFLAMELIPGNPLSEKLKEGPLDGREIVRLAMQLADGLAAAHEQGVIHRDLKPANLFVTPDGRLKILDFGLAKLVHPELAGDVTQSIATDTNVVSGTVPYMSPEQLRGLPVDARSDIYAAGAVLYEMATAQRPFPQKQSAELMGAILHQAPAAASAVNPNVSPGLENVIAKMLEKEPGQRYQSAREFRVATETASSTAAAPLRDTSAAIATQDSGWLAGAGFERTGRKWKIAAPVMVLLILATVAGWLFYARHAHALGPTDTVVLADFSNSTGDPVFDDTLKQALQVQLAQSPFLNILSDRKVNSTLKLMDKKSGEALTGETARELCVRSASKAVLEGSIAKLGSEYVIGLKALNCASGDVLAHELVQAASKEQVLNTMGGATTKFREKLGESLNTVQKYDTPLEQATTSSLDALKAFTQGRKIRSEKGDTDAIPFFKHAIELDPQFAMAYDALGVSYSNLDEHGAASEYLTKAYELRGRVSEREKFSIAALYHDYVTGDREKANEMYLLWEQTYPRELAPHVNVGVNYSLMGQQEKFMAEGQECLRLDPGYSGCYNILMNNYIFLYKLDDAKGAYDQAVARKIDVQFLHELRFKLAFLQDDTAEMQRQAEWAAGIRGEGDYFVSRQASVAVFHGQMKTARELSRRAVEGARHNDLKQEAANYELGLAWAEAEIGNSVAARRQVASALAMSEDRDVQVQAGAVLARAGDAGQAQKIADDLAKKYPSDSLVNSLWLPTIRAAIEIERKNPAKAVEYLRTAQPYELSFLTELYPVYLRGVAYLEWMQGAQAAAEFQKVLDRRGLVGYNQQGALARLGLGRVYAMLGDTAKAKAAYQDFLKLWKDADPDIPVLIAAKSEYAKLQ